MYDHLTSSAPQHPPPPPSRPPPPILTLLPGTLLHCKHSSFICGLSVMCTLCRRSCQIDLIRDDEVADIDSYDPCHCFSSQLDLLPTCSYIHRHLHTRTCTVITPSPSLTASHLPVRYLHVITCTLVTSSSVHTSFIIHLC